jgi:hypothetical protein
MYWLHHSSVTPDAMIYSEVYVTALLSKDSSKAWTPRKASAGLYIGLRL